jgi:hypothetical protein
MPIHTESYEVIFDHYSAAIQWMNGLGIKLTQGRTSHYERILRHWKDAYKTSTDDAAREKYPDFVSSMFEIFDFVSIYKAFHRVPSNQLAFVIEKLQKGVNGPINAAEETSESTVARNFLFEATVAAKAHRPDRGIEAILDAKSDTGILISGKKIWVECKRVTTIDKIESNARKASSQLETLLTGGVGSGNRGIVAMDISKIMNWGDKIFVAQNDDELLASVDRMMDQFIEQHSQIWQRIYLRRHKKIIGTVIRFAFMASSENRNLLVHASQWAINPRLGIAAGDEQIQRQLVSTLEGASF